MQYPTTSARIHAVVECPNCGRIRKRGAEIRVAPRRLGGRAAVCRYPPRSRLPVESESSSRKGSRAAGRSAGDHEIPQQAWKELGIDSDSHWSDPTFDLSLVNHAPTTTVLSSVGFEAIDVWFDLKGFPAAYKIPIVDTLVLRVSRITVGVPQMVDLGDPIAMETGAVARLKLALMGFRANVAGNESLVRLRAIVNDELHQSRLINMGVY